MSVFPKSCPWKKTLSGWQHILPQNLYVPFSINCASKVIHTHNPIASQLLVFELIIIWTVLFLFSTKLVISKKIISVNLRWNQAQKWSTFQFWRCMAFSLYGLNVHLWMHQTNWQWFSKMFLSPCSKIHCRMMLIFNQRSPFTMNEWMVRRR